MAIFKYSLWHVFLHCSPSRYGAIVCLAAALGVLAGNALAEAGVLVNRDKKQYKYAIFWDDMSAPIKGEIGPAERVTFADKPATIELTGKRDSIYVRSQESVYIQNGVMRRQ